MSVLTGEDYICQPCLEANGVSARGGAWWTATCRACGKATHCSKLAHFLAESDCVVIRKSAGGLSLVESMPPRSEIVRASREQKAQTRAEQTREIDARFSLAEFRVERVTVDRKGPRIVRYSVEFGTENRYAYSVKVHFPLPPDLQKAYAWSEISRYRTWINGVPYLGRKP